VILGGCFIFGIGSFFQSTYTQHSFALERVGIWFG
jgi:hypothetical protein